MREKLLVGRYTVQWRCQLLQTVVQSRAEFYMVQRFTQQQKIARQPMLHCAIIRQSVSQRYCETIAQCNVAFKGVELPTSTNKSSVLTVNCIIINRIINLPRSETPSHVS